MRIFRGLVYAVTVAACCPSFGAQVVAQDFEAKLAELERLSKMPEPRWDSNFRNAEEYLAASPSGKRKVVATELMAMVRHEREGKGDAKEAERHAKALLNVLLAKSEESLLGTGRYTERVVRAEIDPNPVARRTVLESLVVDEDPDWDYDPVETHPGHCDSYDHSSEYAIDRLVDLEWRHAMKLVRSGGRWDRADLMRSLGRLPHSEIREFFVEMLGAKLAYVRVEAVRGLSDGSEPEQFLVRTARDSHAVVRQHVAYAISHRKSSQALSMLLDLAFDPVQGVRQAAGYSSVLKEDRSVIWSAIKEVRGSNPARSRYAAELLGALESEEGLAELRKVAVAKAHPARATAIRVLGEHSSVDLSRIVSAALSDTSAEIVLAGCRLAAMEHLPRLRDLAKSKSQEIAEAAKYALDLLQHSDQ